MSVPEKFTPPSQVSSWPLVLGALGVVVCALALWANIDKTLWYGIQGWGRPYWWLDYHHGFVRRGLLGELFQAVWGRLDEAHLTGPVSIIHQICLAALGVVALWSLFDAVRVQHTLLRGGVIVTVAIWLCTSEFWSSVTYSQGYMDVIVLCLAVLAALFVRLRWWAPAGAVLFVGPLVHEYFVFLVPFILAATKLHPDTVSVDAYPRTVVSLEDAPERKTFPSPLLVLAGVAVVSAVLVVLLPDAHAAQIEIAAMQISPADKATLTQTTLTQTLSGSLSRCVELLLQDPAFTVANALFFTAPALVATVALLAWTGRSAPLSLWLRAAAGLFPLSALLIAWDLSRLLVMCDLTAGLLFLLTARDLVVPEASPRRGLRQGPAALAAVVALGLFGLAYDVFPMAYIYYRPGPETLYPLRVWPGDGRRIFGVSKLWPHPNLVVAPRPVRPKPLS